MTRHIPLPDEPSSRSQEPPSSFADGDGTTSITSPGTPRPPDHPPGKQGTLAAEEARRQRLLVARALLLPTEFVLIPLLGLYGGRFLDNRWGTAPWLMVLGGMLGLGAALRSLFEAFRS